MPMNMETTRAGTQYEFRFISVLASHVEENESADGDVNSLNELGKQGWHIVGVTADPRLPAAKLLVTLQRPSKLSN